MTASQDLRSAKQARIRQVRFAVGAFVGSAYLAFMAVTGIWPAGWMNWGTMWGSGVAFMIGVVEITDRPTEA